MNTEQLLEGINPVYIELSDAQVEFTTDEGNDVIVKKELLPEAQLNDIVSIHYTEDPDEINHEYVVSQELDDCYVLVWKKQHNSIALNEANPLKTLANKIKDKFNPDLETRYQKYAKQRQKADEKARAKAIQLVGRDLKSQGRHWSFRIQNEDGSYSDPMSQAEVSELYKHGLTPAIANAIVTTEDGYIVRKGLQDLHQQGVKYKEGDNKLAIGYSMPWPESEVKKAPKKKTKSATKPRKKPEKKDTDPSVTAPQETPKQETENKEGKYAAYKDGQNSGVSKAVIAKFKKVAFATGLELFNAATKQAVDTTSAAEVAKITPETLPDYQVKIRGKSYELTDWLRHAMKNGVITESMLRNLLLEAPVVKLDDEDLMDPSREISFKEKIRLAKEAEEQRAVMQEREARVEELKKTAEPVVDKMNSMYTNNRAKTEIFDMLFDELVPDSGPAPSVGAEVVRAVGRLLYRDSNDGDKFFMGYGLETCASSASYLFDNGFAEEIQHMLDDAMRLADNDEDYSAALASLAERVVDFLHKNPELFWEINEEDSREYDSEYVEENQPKYELEVPGSDNVCALVENGVLNSWDLVRYVEGQLEFESYYNSAEVARPWSHHDTSVTVADLTYDAYERLEETVERDLDAFWADLVDEYKDELTSAEDEYDDNYEV